MKFSPRTAGFTLIEVIVASGIVVVIMGVLISMTDQTQRLMRSTSAKVEQFQEARVAFESMTRRLAQASLNTYWDYKYDKNGRLASYQRSAELRFISGTTTSLIKGAGASGPIRPGHSVFFHAPNGFVDDRHVFGHLDHLINLWGYFVEVKTDEDAVPDFLVGKIPARKRYRLMELMQPSEELKTYQYQQAIGPDYSKGAAWFAPLVTGTTRPVRVLAENVVALFVLPRLSRADEQLWMKLNNTKTLPQLAKTPFYIYDTTDDSVIDPILN
ncbi:MAG: prepilin-type N-terminal cleavage/methylation domain-containing protein, partial [Chthoniobacteraceae bacterium]